MIEKNVLERISQMLDQVRSQNYDCIDTEVAHNRIDMLADAVAEILAEISKPSHKREATA